MPTGGHVISAYALGVVIGAPVFAGLGARLPRRTILVGLMTMYAIGNLLSACVTSYGALLAARFLTGLPHGAYLGVAALVAAELAGPSRRGRAVAQVMTGLTFANVVGVPLATWLGQTLGWRSAFVMGAVLAAACAITVRRLVPQTSLDPQATFRRELGALRRPQIVLAAATGAVGGGGFFAVYSYISPILTQRAGVGVGLVPLALGIWGVSMVVAGLAAGPLVDWRPVPTMLGGFGLIASIYVIFAFASATPAGALVGVAFLGGQMLISTGLQMRLMDVAGDAQTLAAALNHCALNVGNALGAWLGSVALAAGLGLTAPMWVAAGLTLGGLGIYCGALLLERR